jgi:transposase
MDGMKRYVVNLTDDERSALDQILSRERASRELLQRARILLSADEGLTDEEIAEELDVGRATVERVRRRSVEEGLERALHRKKQDSPSRPPKLDGAGEARLVHLACSAPPEGRTRWTLHLLSNKLVELGIVDSISHSTVHRRLEKKRAKTVAGRAFLHSPGPERRFRTRDGGRARRLPSPA